MAIVPVVVVVPVVAVVAVLLLLYYYCDAGPGYLIGIVSKFCMPIRRRKERSRD